MRRAALFAAVSAVVAFAACRTVSAPERNPYAAQPAAVQAGAKLFRQHCAECHGLDARGRVGPSLRTGDVQDRSDRALFEFVTNGELRHGMPSWSRLPEQRRWQIVSYLRSLHAAD